MIGELRNWTIISVAGVIWAVLVIVGAASGNGEQLKTIADLVPFLLIAVGVFEKWGWRWWFLPRVIGVPVIHGTWKGELESLWQDPRTGQSPAKKTVYLAVDQTMTTVSVRLMSDESSSEQIAGAVKRKGGRWLLSSIYVNTPTVDRRRDSRPHHGGLLVDVFGNPPKSLGGEYWTERDSNGKIEFNRQSTTIAQSFREAEGLPELLE